MMRTVWTLGAILFITTAPVSGEAAGSAATSDCLACHGNPDLEPFFVNGPAMKSSVHGPLPCRACHKGVTAPHEAGIPKPRIETCTPCHSQSVRDYRASIHALSRQAGKPEAAVCTSCHGDIHTIPPKTDARSPVYPLNLPRTCARCHGDLELAGRYKMEAVYQLYMDSIHGRAITKSGLLVAANCGSCHGSHDIRSPKDPASRTHRSNVPDTCGACHAGILNVYRDSIHGRRFAAGLFSAPVCTDCHTAHEIRPVVTETWKLDVVKECGTCHSESLRTFRDTYHGQVTRLGFTRVARCADCHGSHDIQPAGDPRSAVHPDRRLGTCQKCHAAAMAGFALYDPHADPDDRNRNPVYYYTGRFMKLLLYGVFAFFGLHTILWAIRSGVSRPKGRPHKTTPAPSERYYLRFSLGQRLLHGLLILSFLGVAVTGLPLFYHDSDWAVGLTHTLGGFEVMGMFHRLFAILLTVLFLYHLGQILYRVAARREWDLLWGPNSLMPQPRDLLDVARNFLWFFGLGQKPRFGRFTYWEKFDYLAVFWGMPVIGLTGYLLWFDEFFGRYIPGWWFNIALLIHGEEALLAVGFIFTIHFFNTHLRPDRFPMDLVIFTGRVTETEMREERPEEYRLAEEGRLRLTVSDPPPAWLRNFGWIVGGLSVAVGLILFVLILMATLGG